MEGTGAIHIRQLVINALRMRPDRIIVGEVRGEEALDMLQAMNTGHDGSLTTLHANTPRDGLGRLEVMVGMANANMGIRSIRARRSEATRAARVSFLAWILNSGADQREAVRAPELHLVFLQRMFWFLIVGARRFLAADQREAQRCPPHSLGNLQIVSVSLPAFLPPPAYRSWPALVDPAAQSSTQP